MDSKNCQPTLFGSSEPDISTVSKLLQQGEVVVLPTETVYGLAANALDPEACRKIFSIKSRPLIDPLIVHVRDQAHASELAELPDAAKTLIQQFWPGPLTIVVPKKKIVPGIVTANQETVALRCSAHPLFQKIIKACRIPLAAPSANPFAYVSPTQVDHVQNTLGKKIKYLVDGGPCEIGIESTIVNLSNPQQIAILRPGIITERELGSTLQCKISPYRKQSSTNLSSPGNFPKHYSPQKTVRLFPHQSIPENLAPTTAIVHWEKPDVNITATNIFWLTENGNPEDAAKTIFALLNSLDQSDFENIAIEQAPSSGIGIAINDRLNRAAKSDH